MRLLFHEANKWEKEKWDSHECKHFMKTYVSHYFFSVKSFYSEKTHHEKNREENHYHNCCQYPVDNWYQPDVEWYEDEKSMNYSLIILV